MGKEYGIVTLQGATNYGAVLQAYALQEYLKSNNVNVEIINYYDDSLYGYYSPSIFNGPFKVKTILGKIVRYNSNHKQFSLFDTFRNNFLNMSKKINSLDDLKEYSKKYDVLIVGSDQVWNSKINKKTKDIYYLNFSSKAKKYSYAGSSGNIDSIKEDSNYVGKYLCDFQGVSVRESDLKDYLEKSYNIDAHLVCDPTLLLAKKEWIKIQKSYNVKDKFILVYMLNDNDNMINSVIEIIKQKNIDVINIGKNISKYDKRITYAGDVSPNQFIYLFNRASYVITNSFHGTAFSIIFDKKFLIFGNGKLNSRMETLLKGFSLEDKLIDEGVSLDKQLEIIDKDNAINYNCDYIRNSKEFLNSILK